MWSHGAERPNLPPYPSEPWREGGFSAASRRRAPEAGRCPGGGGGDFRFRAIWSATPPLNTRSTKGLPAGKEFVRPRRGRRRRRRRSSVRHPYYHLMGSEQVLITGEKDREKFARPSTFIVRNFIEIRNRRPPPWEPGPLFPAYKR